MEQVYSFNPEHAQGANAQASV